VSDFFRTGLISNTSLNISGGGEKVSYNVSAGYNAEQGFIPENGLKRLNIGLGLNAQLTKSFQPLRHLILLIPTNMHHR
jgi:hypothetical protein